MTLYEVFDAAPASRREAKLALAGRWSEALERYRARDFGARALSAEYLVGLRASPGT